MLGGALLAISPIQYILFIDVITAIIGICILLFFVKVPKKTIKKAETITPTYFQDLRLGIKYIRNNPFVMKFLAVGAIFNFCVTPAAILTPLQVARNYGNEVWSVLGFFPMGAEGRLAAIEVVFFVGMALGGLIIGIWGGFKNKSYTLAIATFSFGLGGVLLGIVDNFWIYLICMMMVGLFVNIFNAPMTTMLQTNTDSEYLGRVFSVLTMSTSLMMPLGMVLFGPLGDILKIEYLLISTSILIFAIGFIFAFDKTFLQAGRK
jgi:DHA3 family macrolide efflux protein-like MFS transporter